MDAYSECLLKWLGGRNEDEYGALTYIVLGVWLMGEPTLLTSYLGERKEGGIFTGSKKTSSA